MRTRTRNFGALITLVSVTTLVACSSDSTSNSTAATTATTAGAATTVAVAAATTVAGATTTAGSGSTATSAAGSTGSTGSSVAPIPTQPAGTDTTLAPPKGTVDTEANFIYGYPITVSRLDPHLASISQDATTLFPAYDRLLDVTPKGELVPMLAESYTFSSDGLTLTLKVRQGVTFHDGATLDATAVKSNLDRAKNLQGSSVATDLASIDSVTVVDPATVEVKLKAPNVAILGSFADRAGIMVSPKAIADGVNLDETMVGAGPYKMVSHVPGSTTKFERFDGYWDKAHLPKVKTLEIRVIADEVARQNALETGQISATTIGPAQAKDVQANGDVNLQYNTELAYLYIVQNRSQVHQDDVRVRQAMMYALDRDGMCKALAFGFCEVSDQPFPPGYFAYDPTLPQVLYPYDVAKAKDLMKQAGVSSMDITMFTPAGLPTYPELSEAIQSQWAEIGINVTLQPVEPTQLGVLMFQQQKANTMLAGWGGRPDPSITMIQRASATGFGNPGGVTTPKMTDLIAQSTATADPAARAKALQAGSREMAESVLEMPVYFPKNIYGSQKNVFFTPYLSSKPEFRDVYITK
ncbi:MAG: hypothetical protein JWM12_4069 [Ilumatobacteraceae bacterium]|nr:hypothetical protein [Ilumatobacteraceae bacterium]